MEYIHVETSGKAVSGKADYIRASVGQVSITLFSLIKGLKQKNFGLDTLIGIADTIEHFRSKYLAPFGKKLLMDSGGYSVIVNDISELHIGKLIGAYHEYLVKAVSRYDYIMTLDIPLMIGNDRFNSASNIYSLNRQSLEKTRESVIEHPDLRDKMYLVWQFKTREHFEIWNRIVSELDLNRHLKHRALGGMVGIREATEIDFCPFIANAFHSFMDYEDSPEPANEFRLHFLGINIRSDRFVISLLEKLFESYMGDNRKAVLTYDSISPHRTAQNRLKSLAIYHFQDELEVYREIPEVPDSILEQVYSKELELFDEIKKEIERITKFRNVEHSGAFGPLNIYSNNAIDNYFQHIVRKYELVDLIIRSKNGIHFDNTLRAMCNELSEDIPHLFTDPFVASMKTNISLIKDFSWFYKNVREKKKMNEKVYRYIEKIGFKRVLN